MNRDSENFESLRRLLALKRHEQPPPGYFNRFSGQVIARIKAGEKGEAAPALERWLGEAAWWRRICAVLEAKPLFAGAFGAAVCALLISGIVYSERAEPTPAVPPQVATAAEPVESLASAPAVPVAPAALQARAVSSTNPVDPSLNALFDQLRVQPQAVSFSLPAGN